MNQQMLELFHQLQKINMLVSNLQFSINLQMLSYLPNIISRDRLVLITSVMSKIVSQRRQLPYININVVMFSDIIHL